VKRDLLAGLGVALVLIPQSLAYAELAGLPAQHGLYAAALAPMAAAFFASSPWLQTGPVAVTSLLTLGALVTYAPVGSREYVALAALLALVVGGARIAIGLSRLGWMAFLLSQPVIMGFTSAAALLIVGGQLPGAAGVNPPVQGVGAQALWVVTNPGAWDPVALGLTGMTMVLMLASRRIHPAMPGVVLATLAGLAFSVLTGYRGARVGDIPVAASVLTLSFPWRRLPDLILPGIVIAMVGFAEVAAVAQTFATRERRPWDPNREFVSQGVANLAAGMVGGFPVGGSFNRTSLNYLAGARTRWSGFAAGALVLLFLPFVSLLEPLPRAVLAGVVVSSVVGLVRLRPLARLWVLSRPQALIGWSSFVLTVALAPHVEEAVILSVALALGVHLWRELTPGYTVRRTWDALHLELRGVLWFGSAPILEKALLAHLAESREVRRVVFDLGGLGRIDLTGAMVLRQIREDVSKAGMGFELRHVPAHAHRILRQVLEWEPDPAPGGEEPTSRG
jgi:SulP family sulfate permease